MRAVRARARTTERAPHLRALRTSSARVIDVRTATEQRNPAREDRDSTGRPKAGGWVVRAVREAVGAGICESETRRVHGIPLTCLLSVDQQFRGTCLSQVDCFGLCFCLNWLGVK